MSPVAERDGETVRLTVNAEQRDSPVIELSPAELRRLLAGAERDLGNFLALATDWARRQLPEHSAPVVAAVARVLDLPASAVRPQP
ncbi:hypothetical protein [Kitasatospora sp. NPDC004531]